ncbi:MAG: hypothetical protein M3P27_07715 [Acidobacteriota bacterium]|nr:hypothetical protein [Acidobacteriota bacterium]
MRWTAFDRETAAALAAHVPNVEHAHGNNNDALDSALDLTRDGATNSAAAVLAPARDNHQILVITMRTKAAAQPGSAGDVPAPQPSSYEAGGFLGLSDDPVYERDDAKRKR